MPADKHSGQPPPSRRRPKQEHSGPSRPEFLIVGRVVRPHGVRGEVGMTLLTDYPDHLLTVPTLYLGAHRQPRRVARMRRHRDGMVVLFDSVADRDQAELLRDQEVFVHIDDAVPLEEGEYYLFELQGIRVVADTGEELGRLTGVLETGANDVYVVTTGDNQELLLPVIPQVILKVDIPGGLMIVHLLEGLR